MCGFINYYRVEVAYNREELQSGGISKERRVLMTQNNERKVINLSKPSDRISSDTMFKEVETCNYTVIDGERYIVPPKKEEIKVIDDGISTSGNTNIPTKVTKSKIGGKIKATLLVALAVSGIAFFTVSTVKTALEIKNTVVPEKIEVVVEPQIEIPDVKIEVEQPIQAEPSIEAEEPKQEDVSSDSADKSIIRAAMEKIFTKKTFNNIMFVSTILATATVAISVMSKRIR